MSLIMFHLQFVFSSPVPEKKISAGDAIVHSFVALMDNWKIMGIKWTTTVQVCVCVCVKMRASTFFLLECRDLRKHFCAPSEGGGMKNNTEWMQGLREPCPACADESQRPDLLHTQGSNQHKQMHTCRKVPTHAQTPARATNVCFRLNDTDGRPVIVS